MNLPDEISYVLMSGMATMSDLKNHLTIVDVLNLNELAAVKSANEWYVHEVQKSRQEVMRTR